MKRFLHKVLSIMLTVVVASMAVSTTPVAYANTTSLPDFVDNSESPYFPAIESQGSLGAFKVANSWGTERHNKDFF